MAFYKTDYFFFKVFERLEKAVGNLKLFNIFGFFADTGFSKITTATEIIR